MNVSWRVVYPLLCGAVRGQRPLATMIGRPYIFCLEPGRVERRLGQIFISTAGLPSPLLA
jgi:hypothetical protein